MHNEASELYYKMNGKVQPSHHNQSGHWSRTPMNVGQTMDHGLMSQTDQSTVGPHQNKPTFSSVNEVIILPPQVVVSLNSTRAHSWVIGMAL